MGWAGGLTGRGSQGLGQKGRIGRPFKGLSTTCHCRVNNAQHGRKSDKGVTVALCMLALKRPEFEISHCSLISG
jgi:hypothetical protein